MAPVLGYQGTVTSWAGTNNTVLIGAVGEHTASLNIDGGTADRTQFGSGLRATSIGPGLRTWTCVMTSRLLTSGAAQIGYDGGLAISGSDMYTTHARSFSLNMAVNAVRADEYGSTAVSAGWGQFLRGLMTWTGQYTALVDDTTALKMPFTPAITIPTGTFTLNSGNTLAALIVPTLLDMGDPVNGIAEASYSFNLNGDVTAAGSGNLFSAGTVPLPDFDYGTPANNNLVFTAASGKTFTGPAFVSGISITHAPAAYTDITVTAQGYGALTPA